MVISLEVNRPCNADLTVMVAGGGQVPGACRQYMEISTAPRLPAAGRHSGMDVGVGMGAMPHRRFRPKAATRWQLVVKTAPRPMLVVFHKVQRC